MHAITDRQQRIWEQIYARVFTRTCEVGTTASSAHDIAVEVADNAVGRLIAAGLPVEQMPDDRVERFVKYEADRP